MFNPNNMTVAVGLAKLVEDKFITQCKNTKQTGWKS